MAGDPTIPTAPTNRSHAARGRSRLVTRIAAVALTTTVLPVVPALPAVAATDGDAGKLILVLDSSGSMKERVSGGGTKIAAAKSALTQVIGSLPAEQQVGLRVFGATVPSRNRAKACTDSQLVVPVGNDNRDQLRTAVEGYRPYGETPIGYSLQQAAKDLGTDGQRSIVLVSDGESSCQPDPCPVARELIRNGINLRIDVVGLDVDAAARKQLSCIAKAGNGTYYDVASASELTQSLDKLATRAARPYAVTGKPVVGTAQAADAPEITAGDWTDTVGAEKSPTASRFYRVARHIDGSTLHVSAALRSDPAVRFDGLKVTLTGEDGQTCAGGGLGAQNTGGELIAASASVPTRTGGQASSACADGDVIAQVVRERGTVESPIEIRVVEESPIDNGDALPQPSSQVAWVAPPGGAAQKTSGGSSFVDAPVLRPGVWSDTIVPGEILTYQVQLDWGQQLSAQAVFPRTGGKLGAALSKDSPIVALNLFSPGRARAVIGGAVAHGAPEIQSGLGDDALTVGGTTAPIRWRNREGSEPVSGAALPGLYTISVFMQGPATPSQRGYVVPFTLRVGVSGAVTGQPIYTQSATSASGSASASGSTSGTVTSPTTPAQSASTSTPSTSQGSGVSSGVVGLIAFGLLVVGAGAIVMARRAPRR